MKKNEQQRQKKLAKKRAKELTKKKHAARERNEMQSLAGQIKAAQSGTIESCYLSRSLTNGVAEELIGNVVIARKMPDRKLMVVRYLVDAACLGVKDVDAAAIFPSQFSDMMEQVDQHDQLDKVTPAKAFKYLRGAIDFANASGLTQPKDTEKVFAIWDGVNPEHCEETFTYGVSGVPTYRPGPYEDIHAQILIVEKLRKNLGEGNYQYELVSDEPLEMGPDGEFSLMDYDDELDISIDEDPAQPTLAEQASSLND